ncbi:MAG TPA: NUDIX domain-containing protein [Plantibacter sp.]|uniref:NUDIX hydrolase n=1 Tax=unclassified Plantibacter TaxID=2624265 RepID=UPI002B5D5252|nr:NUDIX domain-containing protein [Plantibacter sp.]
MSTALADILVSAVAIIRERRVLMVTARGRDVLYMPGGKIDADETPSEAAVREAREETAVEIDVAEVELLFTVVTQAHGEPDGRLVRMHVFAAETDQEPRPSAEVSAVHWVGTESLERCPPAGREVLERLAAADLID